MIIPIGYKSSNSLYDELKISFYISASVGYPFNH